MSPMACADPSVDVGPCKELGNARRQLSWSAEETGLATREWVRFAEDAMQDTARRVFDAAEFATVAGALSRQ
jgi:hypothetical protein